MSSEVGHMMERMEEALRRQEEEEGEIATRPTVVYCLDCDEISVDTWIPDGCLDHKTVSSDGYEHGGIQSAMTVLEYLEGEKDD